MRQVLAHPSVRRVDLVDLDPELLELFAVDGRLAHVNGGVLGDERVVLHPMDAIRFVEETRDQWDVVLMDLPDPNDDTLARLYAQSTFRLIASRLAGRACS